METTKAQRAGWLKSRYQDGNTKSLCRDVKALKEALIEQWFNNHAEHCRTKWPHDGDCYWPRPTILWNQREEDD